MEAILATHKPAPLTPGQEAEIDRILEEALHTTGERACYNQRKNDDKIYLSSMPQ